MKQVIRRTLPLVIGMTMTGATMSAHGQFYKNFYRLKGASVSVGGIGVFNRQLTSEPVTQLVTVPSPIGSLNDTASGQTQYTTSSAGVLGSLQFHPVSWAGVEVNYSYTHYSERYGLNLSSAAGTTTVSVPASTHEATGAYTFHPKHIPLQPFVNIGGGGLYFTNNTGGNEWRGTGLVETGLDLPTKNRHLAFRIEGRALFYRAPNFNTPALSTRSWRVAQEPGFSAVYRF